jgi:hypothetical protein
MNLYTMPRYANCTITRKQLRETLLDTNGSIIANGKLWDIKSKHIGAGIYKVWLKEAG